MSKDIDMADDKASPMETHPFPPFIPEHAKLLMCGTFPPQPKRWSMHFYYPNYINDMWRIFGIIYFDDKDYFVDIPNKTFRLEPLKATLTRLGVALSDTGSEVVRKAGNAADKHLDIRSHINLAEMLSRMPELEAVATTGEKAAGVIAEITGTEVPKTGEYVECELEDTQGVVRKFKHWRMPSSSRAYPLALDKKAAAYQKMLFATGLHL